MKLLFDENTSHRLVKRLQESYPESAHVGGIGLAGKTDASIWEFASKNGFVIVSKDDDFRQLSFLHGHPPKVIWLVVGNAGTRQIAKLLERNLNRVMNFSDHPEDSLLALYLIEG